MTMAALMMMGTAVNTFAQEQDKRQQRRGPQTEQQQQREQLTPEQKAERKSAKMGRKMGLSDEALAKFQGIYADYAKEKRAVMEKYPMPGQPKGDKAGKKADKTGTAGKKPEKAGRPQLSDKELEQMHKNHFARSRALIDVEEKFYKKFRSVLTERQYEQLMRTDKRHNGMKKRAGMKKGKEQRGAKQPGINPQRFGGQQGRARLMQGQRSQHRPLVGGDRQPDTVGGGE